MQIIILFLIYLVINPVFAEKLVIGTRSFTPPFEITTDNKHNLTGFDIDLMMNICQRIDAECSFKQLEFPELFSQTLSNKIDLAISAITITEERKKSHLFSLPYFQSSSQFMANVASPINTLEDIRGKSVGIEQGTIGKDLIKTRFPDSSVTIIEFASSQDLILGLTDEKVDVILVAADSAQYWAANNKLLKLVDMPMPDGYGYGIMANLKSTALIEKINRALIGIQNDGNYQVLYKRYFTRFSN